LVLKMYSQKSELFFCEHSIAAIRSLICPLSDRERFILSVCNATNYTLTHDTHARANKKNPS
jgi:hypothetical protein